MSRTSAVMIVFLIWSGFALGREKDSIPAPYHWNVIRINPTPALLFGNIRNITIGYERLVKPDQSFLIQVGYLEINPLFGDSVGGLMDIKRTTNTGLNLAFDYRFFLLRRNQYPAPDGLYLGPYISYYGFKFKDEFRYFKDDTISTSGNYASSYNLVNFGFMLGYQFIFWKRLSVDLLIFGPSLTYCESKWEVTDDIPPEDEKELIAKIREKFNEKYPLLVPFIKPNDGTQSVTVRMFFRYSISVGFHF
jgi:hypothetical protein